MNNTFWYIISYNSINQSIIKSMNQSTNQSINQSINQPINQSINQSVNPSINQPTNQSINQSINQWNSNLSVIDLFGYSQCCTQFKSPKVEILCVLYLHYNVAFTFQWYGNSWNKTFYSQRVWIGYNIELAE